MRDHYAGIGSRVTPAEVLDEMTRLAELLRHEGWWLRSGGARGADTAFASGARGHADIYAAVDATSEAIELASHYHPNWDACNDHTRKLHGRNAMIVLGRTLQRPVAFVACWTPEGQVVGGTGLALRIAADKHIPVFNLAKPNARRDLRTWLLTGRLVA